MDAPVDRETVFWGMLLQGKKKPKNHSCIIKNSNLIKVGRKNNPTMVASSTLILAFLKIWGFYLKP